MSKLKFLIKMFWYLIFIFYNLFIYLFWLCWVSVAARGLSLVAVVGYFVAVHGLLIEGASLVAEHRF